MKKLFSTVVVLFGLMFAGVALACDGGNQCTPSIQWGAMEGIQVGGQLNTMGQALSGADGIGGETYSNAWTFTEGTSTLSTNSAVTADLLQNCTDCADNQVQFNLQGMQTSIAGSANSTYSEGGPAQSISESMTGSQIQGTAWGKLSTGINP